MLTYLLGYNPPLMFVCLLLLLLLWCFLFVFELKKQTFLTPLLHISQSRAIFRSAVYFLQVQFWRLFSHLHSFVNVFWMILWSIERTIGRPTAYRFRLTVRQWFIYIYVYKSAYINNRSLEINDYTRPILLLWTNVPVMTTTSMFLTSFFDLEFRNVRSRTISPAPEWNTIPNTNRIEEMNLLHRKKR